jgi:hypothetical protein
MKRDSLVHAGAWRSFPTQVGHHLVWLLIAVLFCLVESTVFVTELKPFKRLGRRAGIPAAVTPLRSPAVGSNA